MENTWNDDRLELSDVTVSFVEKHRVTYALKNVSLTVKPGEFFVLLGPSGCGKTTLLRAVSGLVTPDGGTIRLGETLFFNSGSGVNLKSEARNVAFIFQNIALYPHMTVRQNLEFPLKIKKNRDRNEINRMVDLVAGQLHLKSLLHRRPRQLSGGEMQRVGMGRAMMRSPDLFLMDEPMSNIDAGHRHELRRYFYSIQRSLKTTTLYVTHDQKEAMALADRLAVVMNGEVKQIGTPLDVYERPESVEVAEFMGETPMNVFEGELVLEADTFFFQTGYARFRLDQTIAKKLRRTGRKTCKLGIRPEFIELEQPGKGDVDAHVGFSHNTGSSRLLYASLGNRKSVLVDRRSGGIELPAAGRVGLRFDPEKLNVFTTAGDRIDL